MLEEEKAAHPRKRQIVEAAVRCFLEKGYHQTGVRDIARAADVSLGNLYNHFRGKEAVLVYIAQIESDALSGFIQRLHDGHDLFAALEGFLAEYAAHVAKPENALLGVEILTEALRNPAIAQVFGQNRNRLIDALAACLTAGGEQAVFRLLPNARAVACMVLDALEGEGMRCLSRPAGQPSDADAICQFLLDGVRR